MEEQGEINGGIEKGLTIARSVPGIIMVNALEFVKGYNGDNRISCSKIIEISWEMRWEYQNGLLIFVLGMGIVNVIVCFIMNTVQIV